MSMISAKCDRLRETAIRVEIFLKGCTDAIPMDTHEQLRSAANIIWELRDKLDGMVDQSERIAELESENAELQEHMKWLEEELRKQGSATGRFMAMTRTYQEDNKKLRDFTEIYLNAVSIDCGLCPYEDPELCDTETDPMCKGCRLWEEMQKLGVNADS